MYRSLTHRSDADRVKAVPRSRWGRPNPVMGQSIRVTPPSVPGIQHLSNEECFLLKTKATSVFHWDIVWLKGIFAPCSLPRSRTFGQVGVEKAQNDNLSPSLPFLMPTSDFSVLWCSNLQCRLRNDNEICMPPSRKLHCLHPLTKSQPPQVGPPPGHRHIISGFPDARPHPETVAGRVSESSRERFVVPDAKVYRLSGSFHVSQ